MIYFCPIHGTYFETPDTRYSNYREQANGTIIDLWNKVSPPPAPELKSVKADSNTTALLILDMEMSICKSPRCIASITNISNLLTKARNNGMLVVYSLTHNGNPRDIARRLAPLPGDPIVKSNVDKFYETNLDEILREKGIKTVIVTGFAANGAVLHTAASAAFHGYNVIVPVDCMSTANILYAEQYTAWHMLNSPATRNRALLTEVSLISFTH
ncbi:cysteine hydrolase [Clostridium sp. YIM B02515]|uniref:Cysteine hydrolase n=1 Tax=Clostridium rhizosphaerae TaxID=2803861 RepID=A0ABS1TGL4_9CLOT|nr:cysteine hydrolase [Clostridium rhizosphaerae]MBL4938519.1 cysteine hydrolase [Clostridium rhizosphaerae]